MRRLAGLLGFLVLLTGCSTPAPATIHWERLELPATGRVVVRDAFECGEALVVLGATADAAGDTRPAAWRIDDGRVSPLPLEPGVDPYAAEAILSAGACRPDGRMSLFGSKSGGAHGLPRSSMWREAADGSLVATRNPFEVFGGPNVGAYGPMAADDRQWVMVGTRTTGGAVWTSSDGGRYRLTEGAFGPDSHVLDVRRDSDGWLAAGFVVDDGQLVPTVWTSPDARDWSPQTVPSGGEGLSEAARFAGDDGLLEVAGFDDGRLALWKLQGERWSREPALPTELARLAPGGGQPAYVTGAAETADGLVVTFSDGRDFRAVRRGSEGTWQRLPVPRQVAVSGDTSVAVRRYGSGAVLLVDDGTRGADYLQVFAA